MSIQAQLRDAILKVLPDVECVIGWGPGPDPLRNAPLFMKTPDDVERFEAGPLSVSNLAVFLQEYKGNKVGIVVKGCDSRSVVQMLAEKLINREDVVIIGYPCEGVLDAAKIVTKLGLPQEALEAGMVAKLELEGESVTVTARGKTTELAIKDVTATKCSICRYPNAVLSDEFVGEKREGLEDSYGDVDKFLAMSEEERFRFWEKEMERCIRCYACRNACPLCVCKDHCVATSRDPHWLTQADSPRDKLFFQLIHATHLAGRCTGCGECARACPVNIPVGLFKRFMNRATEKLFSFQGGVDPEATPPLQTFKLEEPTIQERNWK
ncbi:4Fe-4S binding protein [Desulfovibrio sp. OttesenSCG-928-I05]|nr:4Fe-4S binding protein [Desulfovibrio sp. OttesenSCG-928-I05]